jgi:hypothetical protein
MTLCTSIVAARNLFYFTTPVSSTSCGANDDDGGVDDKDESEPAFLESWNVQR